MMPRTALILMMALVIVVATAGAASACPVCIGDTDSQMAQGTNNAILFMLAMVALVQGGLIALFVSVRRRTMELNQRRDEFQLIEGGAR